ncbi:MAG: hypothetical protein BMS9Abin31_0470 [Gammaproteobacteria bacterium]|nr:MAG: hypothetical protein BMS9Abin31_0470 [Gammaproteobacteria bacterium]
MNIANKSTQRLFFMLLMLMPLQLIKAESFVAPENNIAQREESSQQFQLTSRQIRSRLEHQLVNSWLGHNIDQYLEFGDDNAVATKSSKRLRLRVNRHRLVLQYKYYFD